MPRIASLLAAALLFGLPSMLRAAPAEEQPATERWYEIYRSGDKLGHSRVVWAPSTWEGRSTIRDTTTITQRSVRNMSGVRDVFEYVYTIEIERGLDGELWWQRSVVEEASRSTIETLTWTGDGYESVSRLEDEEKVTVVSLDEPCVVDSEAFLSRRIRAGEIQIGDTFEVPHLDLRARGVLTTRVEVVAREQVLDLAQTGDDGEPAWIPSWKIRETHPTSGATTTLWLDEQGAFVRLASDTGQTMRRVDRAMAETTPVRPAENRITTPSQPVLERVMSADRLRLALHIQGDPDRALPEFPDSRWSRVLGRSGSDEEGWIYDIQVDAFDEPDASATLPIDPEGFERYLEGTVLMPKDHPKIAGIVADILGDETDARKAATLLARYVFTSLQKLSPEVAQASALEILDAGRGDCSEHALLFVTLCRAAGIPTRSCSGYVCVGSQWGAHAWTEVWLGAWVGADPTTGEVGTGARYLLFGYPEDPDSHPGLVSARAARRMRFVVTRLEEGDDAYDLAGPGTWYVQQPDAHRYVHVLAGVELRDVPRDWVVRLTGANRVYIRGPDLRVELRVDADQGYDLGVFGGASGDTTFAGAPARRMEMPGRGVAYFVHSRRRLFQLTIRTGDVDEIVPRLEAVLAPTFAPRPTAAVPAEPEEEPDVDDADTED